MARAGTSVKGAPPTPFTQTIEVRLRKPLVKDFASRKGRRAVVRTILGQDV